MRVERLAREFIRQLFLQFRIQKVLHPFRRIVQVIVGELEVRGKVTLPEAMRSHDALGLLTTARR